MGKKGDISFVITNHVIRYSEKRSNSKGVGDHVGEVELPLGIIEKGIIKDKKNLKLFITDLVQRYKWEGKKVTFTLPSELAHLYQLYHSKVKDRESLLIVNQWSKDIHNHGQQRETSNLLIYSYYLHHIQSYTSLLNQSKVRAIRADVAPQAVYRLYQERVSYIPSDVLVVYWNKDVLTMTTYYLGQPVYTKHWHIESTTYSPGLFKKYYIEMLSNQETIAFGQVVLSGDVAYLSEIYTEIKENIRSPIYVYGNQFVPTKFMDVIGVAMW
ncbi:MULTISPECIES: hypothetical protein [Oceanobacillus]|uniref:Uncharacterized protein n=1 Tax=Oceanobacillus kimchii TaxID=746691 RepID=A0ABQ5TJ02_9BACI|nr:MULTISPECIES: hypothetical protein [Oceanobacillus]MBT2600818.1 hypothetical protein [Oceanobacillus sp. ISL-74]MBT2650785.1 hypothetical protein [Oceanobacillus sp. ISL-73]MCT1575573.1 hypothetical protein [Oceanobacillus kimchii]MCT2137204.1 hypothetical protein [Oceanobacillus kimchii]OEH55386.1 hypothetical protein AQ616_04210 [Oceanobacillus sp. E9]